MSGLLVIKRDDVVVRRGVKPNTFFYKDVVIDNSVTGLSTTGQQAADPCIVYGPIAKIWRVYFFANVNNSSETYMCESPDLLQMKNCVKVLSKGPPGSFDSVHAEKAAVIFYNNTFYMFYSGKDGASSRIGLATSSDGKNFTKYAGNPILTDPEGTGYLDAPTVIRWKDGNFYMWAYNGNGKNIVFRTTPDQFPLGWRQIGVLDSRFFSILSTEAFYDPEIDKILLLANIFYPKPPGVSEPTRTGHLALYVCEEPLKCVYYGVLLTSLPSDTRSYPLRYVQQNVFAPGIAKIGGRYVVLFNATEDGSTASERIFRLDLGVEEEQTLHIVNTYTTSTSDERLSVLRIPPGAKVKIKHAIVYAYSGSPAQLYLADGAPAAGQDNVIAWTNTNRLELAQEVTANGEHLVIAITGTPPISIAYSIEVVIKPAIDILD